MLGGLATALSLCLASKTTHTSCQTAKTSGHIVDGQVTLTSGVTVYCHMMGVRAKEPHAYVPLVVPSVATLVVGGEITVTTFTKARVDKATLKVHTGDLTFATTKISGELATQEKGRTVCATACGSNVGLSCTTAVFGVPLGLSGVCTTAPDAARCGQSNSRLATATIDLTGTGFAFTDAMTIDSQFVRLGGPDNEQDYTGTLADVLQPPTGADGTNSMHGVGATSDNALPFIIRNTVNEASAGRGVPDTDLNAALAGLNMVYDDDDCEGTARTTAAFCDFGLHYGWFSDLALPTDNAAVLPAHNKTSGCRGSVVWPAELSPHGVATRVDAILAGCFGVCLRAKDTPDTTACGWTSASREQHWYSEETAQQCLATQYAAPVFSTTSDTVCHDMTECSPGTGVSVWPTDVSNRQCVACSAGTFSAVSNTACAPWTACDDDAPGGRPGTASSDRVCGAARAGAAGGAGDDDGGLGVGAVVAIVFGGLAGVGVATWFAVREFGGGRRP